MFGMLDYRAHKLYFIIAIFPRMVLWLFAVFGLPFLSYYIGLIYADGRITQFAISFVAFLVIGLAYPFVHYFLFSKFFWFVFTLFIDVIPSNGRSEAQAQNVVWYGQKVITMIATENTPPSAWTQKFREDIVKTDFIQELFYKQIMLRRSQAIFEHYQSLPPDSPGDAELVAEILKEHNLTIGTLEQFLCHPQRRGVIISIIFFIYLIIFQLS
tara:strand:+ start:49 stop:687 length:639 start_codon:yes stop_codon:yes gene_type:complete